jgi:hypothetical protein
MKKTIKCSVEKKIDKFLPVESKVKAQIKISTNWGTGEDKVKFSKIMTVEIPVMKDDINTKEGIENVKAISKEIEKNIKVKGSLKLHFYTDVDMVACDVCNIGIGVTDFPDGKHKHITESSNRIHGRDLCNDCFEDNKGINKKDLNELIKKSRKDS